MYLTFYILRLEFTHHLRPAAIQTANTWMAPDSFHRPKKTSTVSKYPKHAKPSNSLKPKNSKQSIHFTRVKTFQFSNYKYGRKINNVSKSRAFPNKINFHRKFFRCTEWHTSFVTVISNYLQS